MILSCRTETSLHFNTHEFQSRGGTVEAVSTSTGIIFSIPRVIPDPGWHRIGTEIALVDVSIVGRSKRSQIYIRLRTVFLNSDKGL